MPETAPIALIKTNTDYEKYSLKLIPAILGSDGTMKSGEVLTIIKYDFLKRYADNALRVS